MEVVNRWHLFALLVVASFESGCMAKRIPFEVEGPKKEESSKPESDSRNQAPDGTPQSGDPADSGGNVPIDRVFLEGQIEIIVNSANPESPRTLALSDLVVRPLVILVATELCQYCSEEAQEFKQAWNRDRRLREEVRLMSLVRGGQAISAEDWQSFEDVPWEVSWQRGDSIGRLYCKQTPCVIVQTPERGIIYTHVGRSNWQEIRSKLGYNSESFESGETRVGE